MKQKEWLRAIVLCLLVVVCISGRTQVSATIGFDSYQTSIDRNNAAIKYANKMFTGENQSMALIPVTYDLGDWEELKAFAESITYDAKDDREKVERIYEWVISNITYDEKYGTLLPYEVFQEKKAVCNGYTILMNDLCRAVGIPSLYVNGRVGGTKNVSAETMFGENTHSWCMIWVDDAWIFVDPTWENFDLSKSSFNKNYCTYGVENIIPYYSGMDKSLLDGLYYIKGEVRSYNRGKWEKNLGFTSARYNSTLFYNSIFKDEQDGSIYSGTEDISNGTAYRSGWLKDLQRYYNRPDGQAYTMTRALIDGKLYRFDSQGHQLPYSKLMTKDGFQYKKSSDGTSIKIVAYEGTKRDVTIPSTIAGLPVTTIGEGAFFYTSVRSIVVPEGVTRIENGAFYICKNLTKISLPSTLKILGTIEDKNTTSIFMGDIFQECWNLKEVVLPKNLKTLTSYQFGYTLYEVENFLIPKGIKNIPRYAFSSCGVKSAVIQAGIESIEEYAFYYAENMESIYIPATVTNIQRKAFEGCDQLIIRAIKGSYAIAYAKKYGIPYVALSNNTLTGMKFVQSKVSVELNQSAVLTVLATPIDTEVYGSATWTTSNSKIATVKDGKVTAVGFGNCTITAKMAGFEISCKVTVPERKPDLKKPVILSIFPEAFKQTKLRWKKVSQATEYEIYRKEAGGTFKKILTIPASETQCFDTTFQTGTSYQYKMIAVAKIGGKTYRSEASKEIRNFSNDIPQTVTGLQAVAGKGSVTLTWNAAKEATGYEIYFRKSGQKNYQQVKELYGRTNTHLSLTQASGTTYEYLIRSCHDDDGFICYGEDSNPVVVTVK